MNRMAKRWGILLGMAWLFSGWAQAYIPSVTSDGTEVKWAQVPSQPIPYWHHQDGTEDVTATEEFTIVDTSFDTWENVPTASIEFIEQGRTSRLPGALDGYNVVGFSSENITFSPEILGLTLFTFDTVTGAIYEADIAFNDADYVFSPTRETSITYTITATGSIELLDNVVNLQNVATHEIGHFCGLYHSYIDGSIFAVNLTDPETMATMYPYEFNGSQSRTLEDDDSIGLSHLYPEPEFYSTRGRIQGQIVSALDPTEPVFGAHVVAIDRMRQEVVGTHSYKDGSFLLDGLDPSLGPFMLLAEPIPYLSTAQDYWQSAEQQFPLEFYEDSFELNTTRTIQVSAGQTTSAVQHTVLVGFPQMDENEPNDSISQFTDANPDIEIAALISPEDDSDFYRFRSLRGSLIQIEVKANRLNTLLTPLLILYDDEGNEITRNSNYFGLDGDARITYRIPQGGFYFVEVRSAVDNEGGEGYYYLLSIKAIERVEPILADSDMTSVLSFELTSEQVASGKTLYLKEIFLNFSEIGPPYGDFDVLTDLKPILKDSEESGVSLFNDGGLAKGVFDYIAEREDSSDQRLPLESYSVLKRTGEATVHLKFLQTSATVLRFSPDESPDFHVVLRTSSRLHLGDDFKVTIPAAGLVLAEITPGAQETYQAFDKTIPENATVLTGELLELAGMTEVEQRIDLNSNPLAVVGINAVGDSAEEYYLDEVKFWLIGYSARNYIPFYIDSYRFSGPVIARATGGYGEFDLSDLKPLSQIDDIQGGGIALYKDEARVIQGGEVEGDGTFEPGTDPVVPYNLSSVRELPIERVPAEFLDALTPRLIGADLFSLAIAADVDLARDLEVQAYEVTLDLQSTNLAKIPDTDSSNNRTEGPDFFIAIQTSNTIRAMDHFMILIPDEGFQIKNNYGEAATVERPSLRFFDPTLKDDTVDAITCRPFPFVQIEDLTKGSPSSRVVELAQKGAAPKEVLGINMVDYGMSTHTIPQGQGVMNFGEFFNQGYIWDGLELDFESVDSFDRNDLAETPLYADISNNKSFFSHGVAIYTDDDTPFGDFEDNDLDGLIDEELRNGRDDDLDGFIDEPDWGDLDDEGINGVFDSRDLDDHWPPLSFVRNRYDDTVQNAQFVTAPDFNNTIELDGNYGARFRLLARRLSEEAAFLGNVAYASDPWTFSPEWLFIRTGFSPIWYDPIPTSSDFTVRSNDLRYMINGFYVTLGDDEESFDPLLDLDDTMTYDYRFAFFVPDEDGGLGYEYLEGNDVFIAVRSSTAAELGDKFRIQVPVDGIEMSVYQSVQTVLNNSFPVTYPDASIQTEIISMGTSNEPPTPAIVSPGLNRNVFESDFSYEVIFNVEDPDSSSVAIYLYLDNNNLGYNGIKLNEQPLPISQTRLTFSLADPDLFAQVQERFNIADVRRLTEQDQFYIYIVADDFVNEPVKAYSEGYITVDEDQLEDLASYVKLDKEGVLYSLGDIAEFRSVPVKPGIPAVDVEVLPAEDAVLVLRGDGQVFGRMLSGANLGVYDPYRVISFDPDQQDRLEMDGDIDFGIDLAVDLEIYPDAPGYYILDKAGGVHGVGNQENLHDFYHPDQFPPPYFGNPMAVDMELTRSGDNLYILDTYGGVHAAGQDPPLIYQEQFFGYDTARDLTLTRSGNGYYVLSQEGFIEALGDARTDVAIPGITGATRGFLALESLPRCEGYLVMDATGDVQTLLEARIGSDTKRDTLEQDFVDLETIGLTSSNVRDIIEAYFDALAMEDMDGITSLLSEDYIDDHGNDTARLREALNAIFDYYIIGLPTDNSFIIENISTQLSGGQALAVAEVVFSHRYPQLETLAVDSVVSYQVSFDQAFHIFELGDGRDDRLSIFDLDNSTGVFDPEAPSDKRIFYKVFTKEGPEGPFNVFLKYEGPEKNSTYVFSLEDGDNRGVYQPSDVRVGRYLASSIIAVTTPVEFEFSLKQSDGQGFRITKADVLQVLPVADEANPVGFSFAAGGPVYDFQTVAEDDDEGVGGGIFGKADFQIAGEEGLTIDHTIPDFFGIVNLTVALGVTEFDQFRASDYEDIPMFRFSSSVTIEDDQIYLIITKDQKAFGLIRPVRRIVAGGEDDISSTSALIFDWQFLPTYVIPGTED